MPKPTVAKKAAQAYYGFSEDPHVFPRGTRVEFHKKGDVPVKESMFLSALAQEVDRRWKEFVGMESLTARLSNFDVAHIANKLMEKREMKKRVKPGSAEVLMWMAYIAENDPRVTLVRVDREAASDKAQRALLVNTDVTQ
ncbi:MAG: hypothetical protein ACREKH_10595 [Candidatus Rokuibacteriota bacterium]